MDDALTAIPAVHHDTLVRTGKYLRTIDGDTFVMMIDLWAPTRVKPINCLETHIRVNGWNAAELSTEEGPPMRAEFELLLVNAKRIEVYPTGMNRERVVCHVWLNDELFSGLLHKVLRRLQASRKK